jgi:hypothetical protein
MQLKRPDFSGIWVLNLQKSNLEIPPPKSAIFVIDHREPHWVLERTHIWKDKDIEDVLKIELDIDGKQLVSDHGDNKIKAHMYWENETLIFDSEIIIPNETASNVVRYVLKDNGKTFIADENYQSISHSHVNHWVFNKK